MQLAPDLLVAFYGEFCGIQNSLFDLILNNGQSNTLSLQQLPEVMYSTASLTSVKSSSSSSESLWLLLLGDQLQF